ncbi:hypothetical protein [Spiroplasma endosymbiont of Atherix ibis]|uniref:hypothetical protein n=1 Tax=Spiroplasma endosymbiont of Atherix ibis TaxID=3066291 RepID=UPI0030D25F36
MSDLNDIDFNNLEVKATVRSGNEGKEDDLFFLDFVHPTKVGHEFVKEFIFKEIDKKWIQK